MASDRDVKNGSIGIWIDAPNGNFTRENGELSNFSEILKNNGVAIYHIDFVFNQSDKHANKHLSFKFEADNPMNMYGISTHSAHTNKIILE